MLGCLKPYLILTEMILAVQFLYQVNIDHYIFQYIGMALQNTIACIVHNHNYLPLQWSGILGIRKQRQ